MNPTFRIWLHAATMLLAVTLAAPTPSFAQQNDQKAADPQKPAPSADAARNEAAAKRLAEIAEIERLVKGPAANAECVWLGRRVISLLWRDDLDTAFRHLDLYDRFGCPGAHIQASFRCLIRQGDIDPKAPETLNARIHACWINPATPAAAASPDAAGSPTAANPAEGGTTSR